MSLSRERKQESMADILLVVLRLLVLNEWLSEELEYEWIF